MRASGGGGWRGCGRDSGGGGGRGGGRCCGGLGGVEKCPLRSVGTNPKIHSQATLASSCRHQRKAEWLKQAIDLGACRFINLLIDYITWKWNEPLRARKVAIVAGKCGGTTPFPSTRGSIGDSGAWFVRFMLLAIELVSLKEHKYQNFSNLQICTIFWPQFVENFQSNKYFWLVCA